MALEASLEVLDGLTSSDLTRVHSTLKELGDGTEGGQERTVTIQGFGNVGSFTAKFLGDLPRIKVVGVSDVSAFIYDKNGLNIPRLMSDMKGKARLSELSRDQFTSSSSSPLPPLLLNIALPILIAIVHTHIDTMLGIKRKYLMWILIYSFQQPWEEL